VSAEQHLIDLLRWIHEANLAPSRPGRRDQFLNPFTKRITRFSRLARHQRRYVLWIPNARGLRPRFPDLKLEAVEGLTIVTAEGGLGAGTGEPEALLSLLNHLRHGPPVIIC
jgi:hypothetical protein